MCLFLKAIESHKDTLANQWCGAGYKHILKSKQHALDSLLGLRFKFFDDYIPPPSPLEPEEMEEAIRIIELII